MWVDFDCSSKGENVIKQLHLVAKQETDRRISDSELYEKYNGQQWQQYL